MRAMALLAAAVILAGCVDIGNESSSSAENYEVGNDGTVKVVQGDSNEHYTNIPEAVYLELVEAGRIYDDGPGNGVLLPSDEELTEEIYNGTM